MLRQMGFIYIPLADSLTSLPKCFPVSKPSRALASDFQVILRVKMLVLMVELEQREAKEASEDLPR